MNKLGFRTKVVLIGFLAIAGFFLVTEHTAHLYGALPFVFLLGCGLMHLFMHGGHGDGGPGDTPRTGERRPPTNQEGQGHAH